MNILLEFSELIKSNMDYVFFWATLFLLFNGASFYLIRPVNNKTATIYKGIGLFYILQSLVQFMGFLSLGLDINTVYYWIYYLLRYFSYAILLNSLILTWYPHLKLRSMGLSALAILFSIIVIRFLGGNINKHPQFFLGFPLFLLNTLALLYFGHRIKEDRKHYIKIAGLLLLNGLVWMAIFQNPASYISNSFIPLPTTPRQTFWAFLSILVVFALWYELRNKLRQQTKNGKETWWMSWKQPPVLLALLIVAGGFFVTTISNRIERNRAKDLQSKIQNFSNNVGKQAFKELEFKVTDKAKKTHLRLRNQFRAFSKYEDNLSIYSLYLRNDSLFFGPESLEEEVGVSSLPGDYYQQPPKEFFDAFKSAKTGFIGPFKDEYGSFYSAYAPIINKEGSTFVLVVLDIEEKEWNKKTQVDRFSILLLFFIMVLGVFGFRFVFFNKEVKSPRVSLFAVLATLIGMIAGVLYVFSYQETKNHNNALKNHQTLKSEISQYIVFSLNRTSELIKMHPAVIACAAQETEPDNPEVLTILNTLKLSLDLSAAYILNKDGLAVACSPLENGLTFTGQNYSFRPYFQETISKGLNIIYPALGVTSGERGLFFSQPIFKNKDIIGVLAYKIDVSIIDEKLKVYPYPSAMLSKEGIVFSTNQPNWQFTVAEQLTPEEYSRIIESRQFSNQKLPPIDLDLSQKQIRFEGTKYSVLKDRDSQNELKLLSFYPYNPPAIWQIIFGMGVGIILAWIIFSLFAFALGYNQSQINLARSEERFRKLFEDYADPSLIMENGLFTDCNQAAVNLLGFTFKSQIINKSPADLSPKYQEDGSLSNVSAINIINQIMPIRDSYRFEWLLIRGDKSIVPVEVLLTKISLENNNLFYITWKDITEKVKAERELEKYREHLEDLVKERTEKLEREMTERIKAEQLIQQHVETLEAQNAELERFTYTVSHDLKSPLITINGFLDQIVEDVSSGNTQNLESDAQRIRNAVKKMSQLLTDLLDLSKIGRVIHDKDSVNMGEVIAQTLETLQGPIKAKNVKIDFDSSFPMVKADKERIGEVWQNLIENAVKHMGNIESPSIFLGFKKNSKEYVFYITDNGAGIEEKYLKKIFGLFEKLDASSPGTGIGLALAKRIVEFHGGKIWAESAGLGKGSTFFFTLPKA